MVARCPVGIEFRGLRTSQSAGSEQDCEYWFLMSVHWMSWVWKNGPPDSMDRFVLLKLADNANQDGKCWPSLPEIALATCLSESSVRRSVQSLEKGGWLEVFRGSGRGKSSHYILIERVSDSYPLKGVTQKGFQETPFIKGVQQTGKGVSGTVPPSSPSLLSPTPPINPPPITPLQKPPKTTTSESESLPDWLDRELWASWVEMRKRIPRAPFTDRARRGILGDLAKLREIGVTDPNERLEECIKRSWRGVFFDSDKPVKAAVRSKPKSQYELEAEAQLAERAQRMKEMGIQ